ncbi:MAG: magnesium/cobalt transporter CorA [Methylohalobius sp.]|nr:magnesium/cobalt transporter CorA [Methylohalobius sp.]
MKLFPKRYHPPGTPPGTLVSVPFERPITCQWIECEQGELNLHDGLEVDKIYARIEAGAITWVRVQGRPSAEWMRRYGPCLKLHQLAQEDILNGGQRPKLEPYDGQLFLVLNVPREEDGWIRHQQLYLFRHQSLLVSFFEGDADPFASLIERLKESRARLKRLGLDYLLYALVDTAIDHSFPVLESLGEKIERLEEFLVEHPERQVLEQIYALKRELILLHRALWSHREVLGKLLRNEGDWFDEGILVYLRDCYDHAFQILGLLRSYREMTAGLLEIYLSGAQVRLNEAMRVLTVIATIFMPITFVVGVYGMNFRYMPELEWRYGYPAALVLCALIVLVMMAWFRRRGWF